MGPPRLLPNPETGNPEFQYILSQLSATTRGDLPTLAWWTPRLNPTHRLATGSKDPRSPFACTFVNSSGLSDPPRLRPTVLQKTVGLEVLIDEASSDPIPFSRSVFTVPRV